jgi:hypothetical protein
VTDDHRPGQRTAAQSQPIFDTTIARPGLPCPGDAARLPQAPVFGPQPPEVERTIDESPREFADNSLFPAGVDLRSIAYKASAVARRPSFQGHPREAGEIDCFGHRGSKMKAPHLRRGLTPVDRIGQASGPRIEGKPQAECFLASSPLGSFQRAGNAWCSRLLFSGGFQGPHIGRCPRPTFCFFGHPKILRL